MSANKPPLLGSLINPHFMIMGAESAQGLAYWLSEYHHQADVWILAKQNSPPDDWFETDEQKPF